MKRWVTGLSAALALSLASVAAQAPASAETFDAVWRIVRDTHFDPAFDQAKWEKVRDELRPLAVAAKTSGDLRGVLRDMLARLELSHFAVIPASPDTPGQRVDFGGQPGFDVRLIERQLVVTFVDATGGAVDAGVRPGWIVKSVAGTAMAPLVARIADSTSDRLAQLAVWRAAVTQLRGPSGSSVSMEFLDGNGSSVTKQITRRAEAGDPVTVGNLPTMHVRVQTQALRTPGGREAGVIGFNVWMASVDAAFQQAIDRFRSAGGIVIDLRGNPGGFAGMLMGISGQFVTDRQTLGVMKTRESELRFVANPRLVNAAGERVEPFAGPLAILVDALSGSASECFAGGMQSIGRARIFGQTSMGQALPALFDGLPNGDVLIHAWGDFVTADGTRLEGRGVIPDQPVPLARQDLLDGHDRTMEAALAWIDNARAEGHKTPL